MNPLPDPHPADDNPAQSAYDESLALRLEQHLEALRQGLPSSLATEADPELNRLGPVVERLHQLARRLDAPSTIDVSMAGENSTLPPLPESLDLPVALPSAMGGTPPPSTLPVAAQFVGKFRVVRPLGQGGQASTLLAFDPDLKRHVVLKLYHSARTPQEQETVLREGQALARVRSPYVAQCYSAERQDGVPYLVVEYVPGQNLAQRLRTGGLPPAQILTLTRQLAEGLAAVHACGLLHRDVKPGNVLIGDDGLPRLVDFGLAVHVSSDSMSGVSGTLAYMAPEQARGEAERIDARTDLFGLGAVLYELLTGRPPYQATDRLQLLKLARAGEVVPPRKVRPKVPPALDDLCMRCLAREPSDRFRSAQQLADAVARLQRPRRRWPGVAAAAAVLLAGIGLFWGLTRGGGEPPPDPVQAGGPGAIPPTPVVKPEPEKPAVPPPPAPRYHPSSKRLLKNDFALRVEVSTNDPERSWVTIPHGHVHKIMQGGYVRFRVTAPHNCFVGI
jgi:hypothetical protein